MNKLFADLYEKQSQETHSKEPAAPKTAEPEKTRKLGNQETSKEPGQEAKKEEIRPAEPVVSPLPPPSEDRPTFKSSFLYTEEEFEMFEDLKLSLRREHGIQAYKNDLARAAIRLLVEDFKTKGAKSFLVDRFYRKRR
jgi:hypothetical protein